LVVFDVGANIGDVTQNYLQSGLIERIYCFEPAPKAFAQLSRRYANHLKVELVNCGMGATRGELELSDFGGQGCANSFLPKGAATGGTPIASHTVEIRTVDDFCEAASVPKIHVLKIDAQGFDLEVLKGASNSVAAGKIGTVLVELIFTEYYEGQASAGQIIDWLTEHDFWPLCLYPMHFCEGRGVWLDGMFVHKTQRLAHFDAARRSVPAGQEQ
jgi:FkbM family methyltransferase